MGVQVSSKKQQSAGRTKRSAKTSNKPHGQKVEQPLRFLHTKKSAKTATEDETAQDKHFKGMVIPGAKPRDVRQAEAARKKQERQQRALDDYGRGAVEVKSYTKDKRVATNLEKLQQRREEASLRALDARLLNETDGGLLETEDPLERTYRVTQAQLRGDIGVETAKKSFDLKLEELGPYTFDYSRNGRQLLLAGRKGHVATMDWRDGTLGCELQLGETVRDAKWLHNNQFFAVAQKKHVFIYDAQGTEIHELDNHIEVSHMEFLPYHFLLSTIGNSGWIKWLDTSTGQGVAQWSMKQGTPTALAQNPYNAIMHVGHQNGIVSLWSPNSSVPLVKMLCHRGPVRSVAMDREGRYMVSTGQDAQMAVWDVRNFKQVHSYFLRRPGSSLAISDRNLTAVSWGTSTTIFKDLFVKHKSDVEQEKVKMPYMQWGGEGNTIERVRWCPFEDVLGLSHDKGFSSIVVPGAGEPNFDALEVNPYENVKQRQEAEVRGLLNKLQPEMISLDPNFIGKFDSKVIQRQEAAKAAAPSGGADYKARGKNGATAQYLRKKSSKANAANIIDEKRARVMEQEEERIKKQKEANAEKRQELGPALGRFLGKG